MKILTGKGPRTLFELQSSNHRLGLQLEAELIVHRAGAPVLHSQHLWELRGTHGDMRLQPCSPQPCSSCLAPLHQKTVAKQPKFKAFTAHPFPAMPLFSQCIKLILLETCKWRSSPAVSPNQVSSQVFVKMKRFSSLSFDAN